MLAVMLGTTAFFKTRAKVALYAIGSALFGFLFVVRYDSLMFFSLFFYLIVFDAMNLRRKCLALVGSILCFVATVTVYDVAFHKPSSGTYVLNHDQGWVLLVKLQIFYGGKTILEKPSGVAALRLWAISTVLPQDWSRAGAFWDARSFAPPEVKGQYRGRYDAIMRMSESELAAYVADHPLPSGFALGNSCIPIYYYVGLSEGDALGRAVFWEFVRKHPMMVMKNTLSLMAGFDLLSIGNSSNKPVPVVPVAGLFGALQPDAQLANGLRKYTLPNHLFPVRLEQPYWSPAMVLWEPGVRAFGALNSVSIFAVVQKAPVIVGILMASFFFARGRERIFFVGLAIACMAYIGATDFVLFFREKEAASFWPISCLLLAITGVWSVQWILVLLRHNFRGPTST
jgi:hypothetical protein